MEITVHLAAASDVFDSAFFAVLFSDEMSLMRSGTYLLMFIIIIIITISIVGTTSNLV